MNSAASTAKQQVREHWEKETCGTRYGVSDDIILYYRRIREIRARLEPWIEPFQGAPQWTGKRVLEIGVGAGSDFLAWVRAGAIATGVDLTQAAIKRTKEHLASENVNLSTVTLHVADAEHLPFDEGSFDLVYSYGVLHHTPDTMAALQEARRVLAPGGALRVMLYHYPSWTAWLLWAVHCLGRLRPFVSPRLAVFEHLESPGTRCYTVAEAHGLLSSAGFADIRASIHLGPGDMLAIEPSMRYRSPMYRLLRLVYPRPLIRLFGNRLGIIMLIDATKASNS